MLPTIVSPCATVRGTARASRVHSTYAPDGTGVVSVSSSSFGAVGFALSVQPSNTSARTARRRGVPFIGPFGTREQRATVLSAGSGYTSAANRPQAAEPLAFGTGMMAWLPSFTRLAAPCACCERANFRHNVDADVLQSPAAAGGQRRATRIRRSLGEQAVPRPRPGT